MTKQELPPKIQELLIKARLVSKEEERAVREDLHLINEQTRDDQERDTTHHVLSKS